MIEQNFAENLDDKISELGGEVKFCYIKDLVLSDRLNLNRVGAFCYLAEAEVKNLTDRTEINQNWLKFLSETNGHIKIFTQFLEKNNVDLIRGLFISFNLYFAMLLAVQRECSTKRHDEEGDDRPLECKMCYQLMQELNTQMMAGQLKLEHI